MKWTQIDVTAPADLEEAAAACLVATGASGLQVLRDEPLPEFDDAWAPSLPAQPTVPGSGAPGSGAPWPVTLRAYLPEGSDPALAIRKALAQSGLVADHEITITSQSVDDAEWSKSWRRYHRPRRIGTHLVVQPTWSKRRERAGDIPIVVDPGMAFGSGQHATTRLCMIALEESVYPGARILDVGCGSGILSIAAVKLGAASAVALDTDPIAGATTTENARLNAVSDKMTIHTDTLSRPLPADIVVANILAGVVIELLPAVRACLLEGIRSRASSDTEREALFISSGIVRDQEERVRQAHADQGFQVIRRLQRAEWRCLCARLK